MGRFDRGANPDGTIRKGGGLCTYVKQGIVYESLIELHYCVLHIEMSVIKVKLPFTRDIFVVNTYQPPAVDVDMFMKTLQQKIEFLRNRDI